MSVPSSSAPNPRPEDQEAQERAMLEVSAVMTNLDGVLERARKAQKRIAGNECDAAHNARLALDQLVRELTPARKRFLHDTYYTNGQVRLL